MFAEGLDAAEWVEGCGATQILRMLVPKQVLIEAVPVHDHKAMIAPVQFRPGQLIRLLWPHCGEQVEESGRRMQGLSR